jgi:Mg-chelatase subunit ChlD
VAADVTLTVPGATDAEVAGARTTFASARGTATGHPSTRSGWEVSWAPRPLDAAAAVDAPPLDALAASASLSPTETALALSVRARPAARAAPAPSGVLFVIDRSRSVGLPGLAAEHDLARRILERLPPSTRFDAIFFDREVKRLFPMSRPATREAMAALEAEMVPARLQNGTDLAGALAAAAALLHREETSFAPRALLVVITDGALPDAQDGAALARALAAPTPAGSGGGPAALEVAPAVFAIRTTEDEPLTATARQALHTLAGARGGVMRALRANEIDDVLPAALDALDHGGDVTAVRLRLPAGGGAGGERAVVESLAPKKGFSGITRLTGHPPRSVDIVGSARGQATHVAARPVPVDAAWLRPHAVENGGPGARFLAAPAFAALVEPVVRPAPAAEPVVKGSMDRMVVRNVLSLAFMPRARACYLNRTGPTPALRDLTGRVRLAIELVRGEVAAASIESTTLNHPEIERCLRDGAFAIEVPRAYRSDAPVTAVVNLVFRPRTPEKKTTPEEAALGDQIDLIIEELHRTEPGAAPPPAPRPPPGN